MYERHLDYNLSEVLGRNQWGRKKDGETLI
jgi:hypothetical protein